MTDQVQDMDLELEEENVEEAHDPKTAEDQSVASVKAAETKGKKAKGRKGDKQNAEKSDLKQVTAESVEIDADFSDDLNALVEGEATLSEEFKEKTAVIFEAALRSKVAKLNKSTAQAIEVSEELESYKREAVIREAAKDLAETQVEKLKNLAGDIDFVNEDTFARKVATIKESYFTKTPTGTVTEEVEEMEGDSIVETSDAMARYVTAIKQASK